MSMKLICNECVKNKKRIKESEERQKNKSVRAKRLRIKHGNLQNNKKKPRDRRSKPR